MDESPAIVRAKNPFNSSSTAVNPELNSTYLGLPSSCGFEERRYLEKIRVNHQKNRAHNASAHPQVHSVSEALVESEAI